MYNIIQSSAAYLGRDIQADMVEKRHDIKSGCCAFGLEVCPLGNGYIMEMWASVKAMLVKASSVPRKRRHLLLSGWCICYMLMLLFDTDNGSGVLSIRVW